MSRSQLCYRLKLLPNFKQNGLLSDIPSGRDTVCLQMLNYLCSHVPYCQYFFDDICDLEYSIWRNESISFPEIDNLRAPVPNV